MGKNSTLEFILNSVIWQYFNSHFDLRYDMCRYHIPCCLNIYKHFRRLCSLISMSLPTNHHVFDMHIKGVY